MNKRLNNKTLKSQIQLKVKTIIKRLNLMKMKMNN